MQQEMQGMYFEICSQPWAVQSLQNTHALATTSYFILVYFLQSLLKTGKCFSHCRPTPQACSFPTTQQAVGEIPCLSATATQGVMGWENLRVSSHRSSVL